MRRLLMILAIGGAALVAQEKPKEPALVPTATMPAEVLASTAEVYHRLQGAAEVAAAVEKAAKDAAAVRDQLQGQLGTLMGPWCQIAKIDPASCTVDMKTGVVSAKTETKPATQTPQK